MRISSTGPAHCLSVLDIGWDWIPSLSCWRDQRSVNWCQMVQSFRTWMCQCKIFTWNRKAINPYKATGRRDVCHQQLKLLVLNRHFVNFPASQLAVSLLPVYCMNCSWWYLTSNVVNLRYSALPTRYNVWEQVWEHHCVYLLAFKINEQTIYTKFLIRKEFYTLEISDGDLRDTLFLEHWWKPPSGHVDLVEHLKGEERQRDLSNFGGGCLLST